jgi:hypothetical protein
MTAPFELLKEALGGADYPPDAYAPVRCAAVS